MKKKWIVIIAFAVMIVAIMLSFAFCNRNEVPADPTETPDVPTETTAPAPAEPEWVLGYSRASYAEAFYELFSKDSAVEVVGQFMDYYVVSGEQYDILVEKRFIRLSTEDAFDSWTGYALPGINVFESVYMREEPIAQLMVNTRVTILEGKGDWLYIEWEDGRGYVKSTDISKSPLTSNGGNGSAAPADGTDVDVGKLAAQQEQARIIRLGTYYGPEMEENFQKCSGVILAEDVEGYIGLYQYGAEIKVLEYNEEYCTVYLENGVTARVPRYLVALEGDEVEETWIGYTESGAIVFKEYQRRNEWTSLGINTEVEVLYKLPGFEYGDEGIYVVSIDGEIFYMKVPSVSKDRWTPTAGGNSGGSDGSVWTPPVL